MPLYGLSGWGYGRYGTADDGPVYALPIQYYLNLITSEWQSCDVFLGWLETALTKLDDLTQCVMLFTQAFNPDFAVGPQLDMLGVIIGAGRVVPFQPSAGVSPVLDDDTYRILLKARLALNSWDGKISSLQSIWRSLFPSGQITIDDNQNMTATVFMTGVFSSIIQDLISNGLIVPRPEGVLYNYTFAELPVFGFSQTNGTYIAGFGAGHWS